MKRFRAGLADDRGSTIVIVAVTMTALLSAVALAVDVGMLYTARGEAQRVADASALAGAHAFIEFPGNEDSVRQFAVEYAARNNVRGQTIALLPEDIGVDMPNKRVTVTVRRTGDRGGAVATWFARVFGIDEVDVVARATAEALPAGAATCLKPFTIADAFEDRNGSGKFDSGDHYDQAETGYGSDWRDGVPSDNGIDPPGTTYDDDYGRPLVITEGDPAGAKENLAPSIYLPWSMPQPDEGPVTGADRVYENIVGCNPTPVHLGEEYLQEPGRMRNKIRNGVQELISRDDGASWDPDIPGVVGSDYVPWTKSPRVIHIPLYDPNLFIDPGRDEFVFNNITAFWLEGLDGGDVIGRFMYASGIGVGTDGTGGAETAGQLQYVRLVE